MTERDRLLCVLGGGRADRLPWYADLSYLYTSMQERETLPAQFEGEEGYLRFHQELGAGIYLYAPNVWTERYAEGYSFQTRTENGVRHELWRTPGRELRAVWKYLPETCCYACTEHFVKDLEDLRAMVEICENTRYEENFAAFDRLDRLWGDHGIAFALAPVSVSPLQSLLARWSGVEVAVELCYDEEEALEELFQRVEASQDEAFRLLCASPAKVVEFPENLSGEVTGRQLFQQYNLPYYQRRISQLHEAGKKVGIHNDGTLSPCFQLLESCGFDFIEAVTPHPVGDLAPEELRANAGEKPVIFGGLPGALFSPVYSEAEFDAYLERVVALFSQNPGYVLGVADQVPPDGLWERVKEVRQAVEAHPLG